MGSYQDSGIVMVKLVIATVLPATMLVVFRLRSHPEVPTEPSAMAVPPLCVSIRNQEAVPVASALLSLVMLFAVMRPPGLASAAAPKLVALIVSWSSSVCVETARCRGRPAVSRRRC